MTIKHSSLEELQSILSEPESAKDFLGDASQASHGLMSTSDKLKLDTIEDQYTSVAIAMAIALS